MQITFACNGEQQTHISFSCELSISLQTISTAQCINWPWRSLETTARQSAPPLEERHMYCLYTTGVLCCFSHSLQTQTQRSKSTWIVHNVCGDPLRCHICRYGDFLRSVGNLGLTQNNKVFIKRERHHLFFQRSIPNNNNNKWSIHTTSGNSSLTRDMIRDVFPTLAVQEDETRRGSVRQMRMSQQKVWAVHGKFFVG